MSFFAELKRRNVLRAATLYAAGAWLLVQVATQVFPFFDFPNWIVRWIVIAAIIGFPFALVLSWFYELTPEGFKRESEVEQSESLTYSTGRKLDFWIIGVLTIAVVLLLANTFVLHKDGNAAPAAQAPGKSIAVLPFLDLSPNHDQGYFSDGMSEELLNALGQVKDLKVAGRTSSFHFKGASDDLATVGKTLGVANVLEGSVRKQDTKVRISVRLIQIADDKDLWSHEYDGDLSDVFQLQENIARAVTDQLQVVLVGEQKSRLVPVATDNPDAHALYLRASATFERRDGPHFPDAIAELQQAIALDPKFARAHARLASIYAVASNYTALDFDASNARGEQEARAAIALDPKLAEGHAALGLVYDALRNYSAAITELETAVSLDPSDSMSIAWLGSVWIELGFREKATGYFDRALVIDPLLPTVLNWRAKIYFDTGDLKRARVLFDKSVAGGLSYGEGRYADLEHAEGHDQQAIARATRGMKVWLPGFPEDAAATLAQGIYGDAQARAKAIALIDAYVATHPKTIAGVAPWSLLRLGETDRALDLYEKAPTSNDLLFLREFWTPPEASARRLPRFGDFARKARLAEFWDKNGPPDGCRKQTAGDYACE